MNDILDAVVDLVPVTPGEWTEARQDAVLSAIFDETVGETADAVKIPLTVASQPVRRRGVALVASAAALVAAASAVVALTWRGSGTSPTEAAGRPWDPPAGLSDTAPIDGGKYVGQQMDWTELDAGGAAVGGSADTNRTFAGADGAIVTITGTGCERRSAPDADQVGIERPTEAFFASLPTDVGALQQYLREHVTGSSSLDEAVFVAVSDSLLYTDGLASPRVKAAMLAVLSRTPGVVLHEGVRDYLGRPAIRADFVDQAIRPGAVQSLYFDPNTFALLEHGDAANGEPTAGSGPSPAYTAHAGTGVDPDRLSGPGGVSVITHRSVVQTIEGCSG